MENEMENEMELRIRVSQSTRVGSPIRTIVDCNTPSLGNYHVNSDDQLL